MTIKSVFLLLLIAAPYLTYGIAQTSRLHDAVRTGNLEKVKSALKPWKSVNGHNQNRSTPLQIAISGNHADIVEFLISKGAQIYLKDRKNSKIDHVLHAVQLQKYDIAEFLLKAGGPPPNSNALFEAIRRVDPESVALLLKYRSPVADKTNKASTAMQAVLSVPNTTPIERRIAVADLLLAHGARLSSSESGDANYNTLLHQLFWQPKPDLEMAGYLLDRGVLINALDNNGQTALRIAVIRNSVEGVRFLLDRKADPNISVPIAAAINSYGEPDERQISVMELLIKHGADLNKRDRLGNFPLMRAAKAKSYVGVKLLLDAGAKPDAGQGGNWISEISTTEVIKALLLKAAAEQVAKEKAESEARIQAGKAESKAKAQARWAKQKADEQAGTKACIQAYLAKRDYKPQTYIPCPPYGYVLVQR